MLNSFDRNADGYSRPREFAPMTGFLLGGVAGVAIWGIVAAVISVLA